MHVCVCVCEANQYVCYLPFGVCAGEKPAADANDGNKTLCAVLFIARRTGVMGIDLWRRQTANWKKSFF